MKKHPEPKNAKPKPQKGVSAMKVRKVLQEAKEPVWINEIARRAGLNPSSVCWALGHSLRDEVMETGRIDSPGKASLVFYKLKNKGD